MSTERIKMQGRKVEKERELKELERKADNLVINVRGYVDPFEEWLDLQIEHGQQAMNDLFDVVRKGREIRREIKKLNRELGEG